MEHSLSTQFTYSVQKYLIRIIIFSPVDGGGEGSRDPVLHVLDGERRGLGRQHRQQPEDQTLHVVQRVLPRHQRGVHLGEDLLQRRHEDPLPLQEVLLRPPVIAGSRAHAVRGSLVADTENGILYLMLSKRES